MSKRSYYFFVGTLVELIKISPVIKEFKKRKIPFRLVTSGQNDIPFEVISEYTGQLRVHYAFPKKNKKSSMPLFALWALGALKEALFFFNKESKNRDKKSFYLILEE